MPGVWNQLRRAGAEFEGHRRAVGEPQLAAVADIIQFGLHRWMQVIPGHRVAKLAADPVVNSQVMGRQPPAPPMLWPSR